MSVHNLQTDSARAGFKPAPIVFGWLVVFALVGTGCIQKAPRIVKIGLVAPFEGRYREIGYDLIPAARLAIREWAERNDTDIAIEIVAYDDMGDPDLAVVQARRLVVDPDIVVVIGHWRSETTQAALPIYAEAGLPVITFDAQELSQPGNVDNLAPTEEELQVVAHAWVDEHDTDGLRWLIDTEDVLVSVEQFFDIHTDTPTDVLMGGPACGLNQFYALANGAAEGVFFVTGTAEPEQMSGTYWTEDRIGTFVAGFKQGSLGAPPGLFSVSAYEATWLAIELILTEHSVDIDGTPVDSFEFDERGRRVGAPIYLYVWHEGQREFVVRLR